MRIKPIPVHESGSTPSIRIRVPKEEFDAAVSRFLTDSLSPATTGVSSRSSAEERKDYARRLSSEGVAAKTFGDEAHEPDAGSASYVSGEDSSSPSPDHGGGASSASPHASGRDNKSPDKRRQVIPPSFSAKIQDKKLKRLYDELKKLDATEFSFASVYLLRTVLEKTVTLYLIGKAIPLGSNSRLHERIKKVCAALKAEGLDDRVLKNMRVMGESNIDDQTSPDSIGHYVHGGAVPPPTFAFRLWDNIEDVMRHMLSRV